MIKTKYNIDEFSELDFSSPSNIFDETNIFISSIKTTRTAMLHEAFEENTNADAKSIEVKFDCEEVDVERDLKLVFDTIECDDVGVLNIVVDISLIKRSTIATIFAEIFRFCKKKTISLDVVYSLAKYTPPEQDEMPITDTVEPVHEMFSGWTSKPGLPVMSVVGLGYEQNKAMGAVEYLESSNCYLFIPESPEKDYRKQVEIKNDTLLSIVGKDQCLEYDVLNPIYTIFHLDSFLRSHKLSNKVVLLPFGPKIFYVASLLAAIVNPEVSVWNASGNEKKYLEYQNREPVEIFGFKCRISRH